jgi:MFS family permease
MLIFFFYIGISFQWMWLSTSKTVNTVTDTYYERMKLRAIMSSLYTCVGPVIGVLIIGGCLDSIHDYAFLINQCLFLFVASFLISWGWSL